MVRRTKFTIKVVKTMKIFNSKETKLWTQSNEQFKEKYGQEESFPYTILSNTKFLNNNYEKTKLNNNILILGTDTDCVENFIIPNISLTNENYFLIDYNNYFYNRTRTILEKAGYEIIKIDFNEDIYYTYNKDELLKCILQNTSGLSTNKEKEEQVLGELINQYTLKELGNLFKEESIKLDITLSEEELNDIYKSCKYRLFSTMYLEDILLKNVKINYMKKFAIFINYKALEDMKFLENAIILKIIDELKSNSLNSTKVILYDFIKHNNSQLIQKIKQNTNKNINFTICLSEISKLKDMYEENLEDILNLFDIKLYFGTNNSSNSEFIKKAFNLKKIKEDLITLEPTSCLILIKNDRYLDEKFYEN